MFGNRIFWLLCMEVIADVSSDHVARGQQEAGHFEEKIKFD